MIVLTHDASSRLSAGYTRIARVVIGDRVFVGAGAILLPGTKIGDDAIVAAGAVVRGNVPPGKLVAGNPAKIISDVQSVAAWHRNAAAAGPQWPHEGWTIGRGITEARKHEQREALASGISGYLGGPSPPGRPRAPGWEPDVSVRTTSSGRVNSDGNS